MSDTNDFITFVIIVGVVVFFTILFAASVIIPREDEMKRERVRDMEPLSEEEQELYVAIMNRDIL
jgi:hypothetical protein